MDRKQGVVGLENGIVTPSPHYRFGIEVTVSPGNVQSFVVSRSKGGGSAKSSLVENCDSSVWVLSVGGPESTPDERGLPGERWGVPLRGGVSPMARPFSAVQRVRMREVGKPMKPPQELPASSSADDDVAFELQFFLLLLPLLLLARVEAQCWPSPGRLLGLRRLFAGLQRRSISPYQSIFNEYINLSLFSSPTRSPDAPASGRGSSSSSATVETPPPSTTQPQAIPQLSENQANLLNVPLSLTSSAVPPSNISRVGAYNTDTVDAGQVLIRTNAREQAAHPRKRCRSDASVEGPSGASIAREIKKLRLQPASNASSSSNSSNGDSVSVRSTPPTTPGDDGGALSSSECAFFFPADNIPRADDQDQPSDESDEESESEEAAEARCKAKGKGRAVGEDVVDTPGPVNQAYPYTGSDLEDDEFETTQFLQAIAESSALARSTRYIGEASTSSASRWVPPLFNEETLENDDARAREGEEEADCESHIQVPLTDEEARQINAAFPSGDAEQDFHFGDTSTAGDTHATWSFEHLDTNPAAAPVHADAHYAQQHASGPLPHLQAQPFFGLSVDHLFSAGPSGPYNDLSAWMQPHDAQRQDIDRSQTSSDAARVDQLPLSTLSGDVLHAARQHVDGEQATGHPDYALRDSRLFDGVQDLQAVTDTGIQHNAFSQVDQSNHTHIESPLHMQSGSIKGQVDQEQQQHSTLNIIHWQPPASKGTKTRKRKAARQPRQIVQHPHPPAQAHSQQPTTQVQATTLPPAPSINTVTTQTAPQGAQLLTGLNAATPLAVYNQRDLHTCGYLVRLPGPDKKIVKCGYSLPANKNAVNVHLRVVHGFDVDLPGTFTCEWHFRNEHGALVQCNHHPSRKNYADSIVRLHFGPKADRRVCDYPECMVPTGRERSISLATFTILPRHPRFMT
ncbi:hypothetical protein FA13DRAFT_1713739 [Coprinellus micaceus]|uniref:Uncharacterized protein n=1 Tax=Coprinellus micaceus TaxID=71717 RepID=A0A4Y7SWR0_COPMI|nr:hypothetical protein FA13DRAFT_1713739 [Coprinellus micaceus]